MTWIQLAIGFFTVLVTNGAFFYSINRKIKTAELKDKEIEIVKKQDDEWQELYQEEKQKRLAAEQENTELRQKNENLVKANGMLELKNQQLTWYRCTVNNCPNRRPPHYYDHDGNELEACS